MERWPLGLEDEGRPGGGSTLGIGSEGRLLDHSWLAVTTGDELPSESTGQPAVAERGAPKSSDDHAE